MPHKKVLPDKVMLDRHINALSIVVQRLESKGIAYQVTGGIAGNIHGSLWPPHDIDLEVGAADFERVAELFAAELIKQPYHHIDEEFEMWLMTLMIDDIEVDINQVEDSFAFTKDGSRVPIVFDLKKAERRTISGLSVMVQPLKDLIAYKTLIGREADVADLLKL